MPLHGISLGAMSHKENNDEQINVNNTVILAGVGCEMHARNSFTF